MQAFIQNEGYKVCNVRSWGSSAVVVQATTEQGHVVALKILRDLGDSGTTNELEILGYLQLLKSHRNHTIELLHVIQSNSVSIIVMPWKSLLDVFLHGCPELTELLWNQLLNGVWFLHDHGIAHLDLKPDSLLVSYKDLSSARLSVIDFGIAIHVKSEDTLVKGYRGTPPWSAPEIGEVAGPPMKYSTILTDRWSCGRVLRHIRGFSLIDNPVIASIHDQLLHLEPSRRPSFGQVLKDLQEVASAVTLRVDKNGASVSPTQHCSDSHMSIASALKHRVEKNGVSVLPKRHCSGSHRSV